MTPEQLEEIPGIGPKTVEKISLAVNNYFASLEATEATESADAAAPAAEGEATAVVAEGEAVAVEAAGVEAAAEAVEETAALDTTESGGLDAAPNTDIDSGGVKPEVSEYEEAAATGQALEADAIAGVENAPDADVAEVHTHGDETPAPEETVEPEEK